MAQDILKVDVDDVDAWLAEHDRTQRDSLLDGSELCGDTQESSPTKSRPQNTKRTLETLDESNILTLMKVMACFSIMRTAKSSNIYLFEACLFVYLAHRHLTGLSTVVEEAAEMLGVTEEQSARFVENFSTPKTHPGDEYLLSKFESRRKKEDPMPMLILEEVPFTTKSGVSKTRHKATFTKAGEALIVDIGYLSVFKPED